MELARHRESWLMTAELCRLTVRVDTGRWSETVLTEVDLVVPAGRITAVLGGPGAGKTMVGSALTGRLPATAQYQGRVLINGEAHRGLGPAPTSTFRRSDPASRTRRPRWCPLRPGFADHTVILHAGRVVASGTTAELTNSTDAFVQTLLGSGF